MAKVDINEALLKKYDDKELIDYVAKGLRVALDGTVSGGLSKEAELSVRLVRIDNLVEILEAVNKRLNKDSMEARFMV